jgi:hypothetical protein
MNVTAAITHLPQALTASDFGRLLAIDAADPGRSVRKMFREGRLPGPNNPGDAAGSWRWSPTVVRNHIDPQTVAA